MIVNRPIERNMFIIPLLNLPNIQNYSLGIVVSSIVDALKNSGTFDMINRIDGDYYPPTLSPTITDICYGTGLLTAYPNDHTLRLLEDIKIHSNNSCAYVIVSTWENGQCNQSI